MKVAIAGKGGSGKSTVTALAARGLSAEGYRVLVVDADESNVGLFRLLQVDEPEDLVLGMGGRKELGARFREAKECKQRAKIFDGAWTIDDIPTDLVAVNGGISLVQIGKINEFGEGCACIMGMLFQEFLKNIELRRNEMVLIDMEAGIEHMGRGIEKEVDLILAILDPSLESVQLLEKMGRMSKEADRPTAVILNKTNPKIEPVMRMAVRGYEIAAEIPYDEEVILSGLDGEPLPMGIEGGRELTRYLVREKNRRTLQIE